VAALIGAVAVHGRTATLVMANNKGNARSDALQGDRSEHQGNDDFAQPVHLQ